MVWILFVVLFLNRLETAEWVRKQFLLPNWLLLFVSAVIICLAVRHRSGRIIMKRFDIRTASLILFILQLFISYNIYFETGWDAGENVMTDALALAYGESIPDIAAGYYSMYPNNIFILFIEKTIFSILRRAGIVSFPAALYVFVVLQCILSCLTGYMLFCIIKELNPGKHAEGAAVFGWFIYVLLIGLSPWLVVVYTDSLALILPVSMVYLYLKIRKKERYTMLYWSLVCILAYWGYRLKATAAIMFIALMMTEVFSVGAESVLSKGSGLRKTLSGFAAKIIILVLVFLVSGAAYRGIENNIGFAVDKEKEFTFRHYLMMGWNEESTGTFNYEDVDRSMFINDYEYRNDEDLTEAKHRIRQMLPFGVIPFQARKTLVNFHDGTFSFGIEGNFYMRTFASRSAVTDILRSIFWDTGKNYRYLALTEQAGWITVLFLCLLNGILNFGKKPDPAGCMILIAVTGVFLFVELFEARARYLYIYVPVFIISASSAAAVLPDCVCRLPLLSGDPSSKDPE
ncbi:MAG: hypothetical protein J6P87_01110 [Lachnospiraceae bacterium]|nr:hypothetical protein [Lachnospiraceae bacterium]